MHHMEARRLTVAAAARHGPAGSAASRPGRRPAAGSAAQARKGRRRSRLERRRPFRQWSSGPLAARVKLYFTVTVLTAEVLDEPECVTRTRILYLPFFAGAFHLSE